MGSDSSSDQGFLKNLLARLFSGPEASLRESVEEIIEEHENEIETSEERSMLINVLAAADKRAEDVMVPRADIVALDIEDAFLDVAATFVREGHSRMPVFRDSLDDIAGMIHVRDILPPLLGLNNGGATPRLSSLLRPVIYAAPSMRLHVLLAQMRTRRIHMAIVVDEYGGTDGLVTIEDLLEQIVGEIEDEHDEAPVPLLRNLPDGRLDVDARVEIAALEKTLGLSLGAEGEDVDTVGGLVGYLAGRVPEIGEILPHPSGVAFEVISADPRKVQRVRVTPPSSEGFLY